jgi:hypothetical protein
MCLPEGRESTIPWGNSTQFLSLFRRILLYGKYPSAGKEIAILLWNMTVHYTVHKKPPLTVIYTTYISIRHTDLFHLKLNAATEIFSREPLY